MLLLAQSALMLTLPPTVALIALVLLAIVMLVQALQFVLVVAMDII